MTEDAEPVTGDPRWHNFCRGYPPGFIFHRLEASWALNQDVIMTNHKILAISDLILRCPVSRNCKVAVSVFVILEAMQGSFILLIASSKIEKGSSLI